MEDDYMFDGFNDGSERLVGEHHLTKLKSFVTDYAKQLAEIEVALEETLSQVFDSSVDPIGFSLKAYEHTNVLQLVKTDNKVFNKIMLVFSSLCSEIQQLKLHAWSKFYAALKFFGEIVASDAKEPQEGDTQLQFARFLDFLIDLNNFVNRCHLVCKNIVHQLASIYHMQQKLYTSFKSVHLQPVFEHLAELFGVLIGLDEVIQSNSALNQYIGLYKRMVKAIKSDPARYQADEDKLWQVEKILLSIKGQILDGRIFLNCVEQEFDSPGILEVSTNKDFKKEVFLNLRNIFTALTNKIGESTETRQRSQFVGWSGLYIFYVLVFKDPTDKKFFKTVWDVTKKLPMVHIYGDVIWTLDGFIAKCAPILLKSVNADLTNQKREYLKVLDKDFVDKVQQLYLQSSIWMVRMESNLTNRADLQTILNTRIVLLSQGIQLAFSVSNLFKEVVNMHLGLSVPLKSSMVKYLIQCIEILKGIQATFHRRSGVLAESIPFLNNALALGIQRIVGPVKAKLEASVYNKKSDAGKLDAIAAATLTIDMVTAAPTPLRRLVLRLALQALFQYEVLREEEVVEITKLSDKIDAIADFQLELESATNCYFVYWSRSMLPQYFMEIYNHPHLTQKLQYMFSALTDVISQFKKVTHVKPEEYTTQFQSEIESQFKAYVMDPLCRDIEKDLRFHIHSHLGVAEMNPWKNGVKDYSRFFKLRPLRFANSTINIKNYVGHYLDTTFYNLTTVALHDWKTYGEMRNLAAEKYGLDLTEVYLPSQTLDQGIDVLQIMRNIHIFVAKYHYNLHNQFFIERNSDSKTLNTISIMHISNSIRTHGIGIMNTTVNFIYQFLRQKFAIFSQFLYDDHIKSRLYRDIRYFKEHRDQLKNQYPFERSSKFNKEIKKLGVNDQKLSYLDQFRNLITEIGNAMGYIRMIRSAGFHYISNAIKFVPDLEDIIEFRDLAEKDKLSAETVTASKNLDIAIESLSKNFSEGTEYFRMLVDVFADEFRSPQNVHLKNFFIIVPPLTINFVEHILLGKDKLTKKKPGGFFTDDGFAIGVAYILKLLDQYKQFDSLHWFQEVAQRYNDEQKAIANQLNTQKKEEQQTAILTQKKLKAYLMEFDLLRYTFDGARVFFRSEKDLNPKEEKAPEPTATNTAEPAPPQAPPAPDAPVVSDAPPPPPPPPPPPF